MNKLIIFKGFVAGGDSKHSEQSEPGAKKMFATENNIAFVTTNTISYKK